MCLSPFEGIDSEMMKCSDKGVKIHRRGRVAFHRFLLDLPCVSQDRTIPTV